MARPSHRKATSPSVVLHATRVKRRSQPFDPALPTLTVTSVLAEVDVHLKSRVPAVRATTAPATPRGTPRQPTTPRQPSRPPLVHQASSKKNMITRTLPRTETELAIMAFQHLFVDPPLDLEGRPSTPRADDEKKLATVASFVPPKASDHNSSTTGWSIKDVQHNYGWGGKQHFMARLRKVNMSSTAPAAPRTASTTKVDADSEHITDDNIKCADDYIRTCLQKHLVPEPFIIPKREACAIDLSYYGAGNRPIEALSSCLASIPKLQTLVVRENRLTDVAVANVVKSSDFTRLLTLNLSNNEVKQATVAALSDFLDAHHVLQTLVLSDCGLSIEGLTTLGAVLGRSRSLTAVDVSKNKLDDACGDALRAMLCANGHLTLLDLSWNCLRAKTGTALAHALAVNTTLQTLRAAWNGFGSGGGASAIALSLRHNKTLHTLDLTGNSLGALSALSLVRAWADSTTLEILCIAQNPIGTEGLRAIFRAYSDPLSMTQGRTVQYDDCGLHTEPARFAPVQLGHVEVDLDDADSFWRGFEYLWLLNLYPSAASWRDVQYQLPPYTTSGSTKLVFGRAERATSSSYGTETVQKLLALDGTRTPWRLPLHGRLRFEFTYKPQSTVVYADAVSVFWQAFSELEFDSDRAKYIQHFLHDHYITASQAQYLLGSMTAEAAHAHVAPLLLQRVADTAVLFNRTRRLRHQSVLKERAGKLLFFDSRLPNGRYALDLAAPVDKRLASTLVRLSADDRLENKKTASLNTSQNGNWECFRNETLDGAPYSVSRAHGLPSSGTFAFDFVLTTRIPRGSDAIPDDMLDQLCVSVTALASTPVAVEKPPAPLKRHGKKAVIVARPTSVAPVVHAPHTDTGFEHRKLAVRQTFSDAAFGIHSAQLVRLAHCFHDVAFGQVEIVAMLLNRVLDLDDLLVALAADWTRENVGEAIHRIGWLNLWNPMFAEMEYHLNLSVWEEYQVTSMLAQLGDIEPGENWVDERFNDQFGWELPLSWVQGRIPHTGDLYLRYTTGASFKNRVNAAREDMKKRVLCGKPRKMITTKDNDGSRHVVFAPTVAPATPRRHSILRAAF
ncbi:hypothetical protein SDRG_00265 [Saprolegnia diclina VS20]|uniref:DUF4476 domain-containing protein n=1 Tax=Saprolegnia diclina (strain VS20) TaxID=1156394 RepID=T0SB01_SAPDV|nr:hypothetical protein SDRG_00265 [Saprolegnia diclina VS20]EQC42533.1 hypothetical protein SDRG_00265 [Saprolegnia diclina VS20]|eukprot:XP_008603956.1 hypothetical protein SDRG_00265 [Saprolegnia diclina VS20]